MFFPFFRLQTRVWIIPIYLIFIFYLINMIAKDKFKKASRFHELIQKRAQHGNFFELRKLLASTEYNSVLDIGFDHAYVLFILYHDLNFNILKGIDSLGERDLCYHHAQNRNLEEKKEFNNFFDYYNGVVTIKDEDNEEPWEMKSKIQSRNDFMQIFDLQFYTYQHYFLSNNQEKFDLIVSSNSLHYETEFSKMVEVVQGMKNSLNTDGLIYIRVKEKPEYLNKKADKHNFQFEEYQKAIEKIFGKELEVVEHEETNEGRASTFTNILNFLG
ncbi:MAG: hypothetical protein KDE26_07805 [Bacteroidetes bacterium]|nr:hypothetical protein [Bacteroidota bacterium]